MKIAVIRYNQFDSSHLVEALISLGHHVIDVFHRNHIEFGTVSSEGDLSVYLKRNWIGDFDRILYINVPDDKEFGIKDKDEQYLTMEYYSAFIAALRFSGLQIINSYDAFDFHQILKNPIANLNLLREFGWHTPLVQIDFDLTNKKRVKQRFPDPAQYQKFYFVVTQKRYMVNPAYPEMLNVHQSFFAGIYTAMSRYMIDNNIEWLVVPFIVDKGMCYAYGLSNKVPHHFPEFQLNQLIKDIIS